MREQLDLLRTRPRFRRLWLSGAVSLVGDWLGFVAVSLLTVHDGGGPLGLALVLSAHALPHALLSPYAGVLADRMDRKRLLVIANFVQALMTLVTALAAARGAVALVTVLVLLRSAVSAFVVPAEAAALRRVVEEDELLAANAFVASTWSVALVVGMAAGGVIATLGPALALVLDAASFALAGALVATLPVMLPEEGAAHDTGDLRTAWRHACTDGALLRAVLAKAPVTLAGGASWVTLTLVASERAPIVSAALSLGVLNAVRGAGTGVGPLVGAALARRGHATMRLLHAAAAVAFVAMIAFAFSAGPAWLLGTAFVWGAGSGANWVLSSADLQRLAPDSVMGRLAAIDNLASTLAQVVGALAGGAIASATGSAPTAAWLGVALGVLGWIALTHVTARSGPKPKAAAPLDANLAA